MPGRICALELMPDRIQSKNETTHIYKYNITFIDKYFIGKWQTRLYNEAEVHLRNKSTGYIKLLQFWVFQYFLSSKSTFGMHHAQTGRIQF